MSDNSTSNHVGKDGICSQSFHLEVRALGSLLIQGKAISSFSQDALKFSLDLLCQSLRDKSLHRESSAALVWRPCRLAREQVSGLRPEMQRMDRIGFSLPVKKEDNNGEKRRMAQNRVWGAISQFSAIFFPFSLGGGNLYVSSFGPEGRNPFSSRPTGSTIPPKAQRLKSKIRIALLRGLGPQCTNCFDLRTAVGKSGCCKPQSRERKRAQSQSLLPNIPHMSRMFFLKISHF